MTLSRCTLPRGEDQASPAWITWLCFALAAGTLVFFRLHAFGLPLETDECNYAYIGAGLLEGDRLYIDVWDHQPFGVFALFAGVIAIFGNEPVVFRLTALAFSVASLGLIFSILRRGFGMLAAVSGAFLFAIASSDPGTAGEGCNREIYMNTAILGAWYLLQTRGSRRRATVLGAGIALALGSAIKTILAIPWLVLAVFLVVDVWRSSPPERRFRSLMGTVALFAAGPVVMWLAALGYFAATGRAGVFVDAVFLFNLSYADGGSPFVHRFAEFFTPRHRFIFHSAMPLWIAGLISYLSLVGSFCFKPKRRTILILSMLTAAFLAVCLPGRFWPHYYYLLIPPLIVAVAATAHEAALLLTRLNPRLARPSVVLFAIVPLVLILTEFRDYLDQPPFGITVKRYNSRDFWGQAMGEKVRRVTEPGDEVFVFGSDTAVYYYSSRRCASRYTMITGISSAFAGAEQRRAILLDELRERRPRIILVLFDEPPFDDWLAFLEDYYEPIGQDLHDRTGKAIMFVYALKSRPVELIDWNWDRSEVGGW